MRYGTTSWLTLEGRGDVAREMNVVGAGASLRLGLLGVLNGAYSMSKTSDGAFNNVIEQPNININDTTMGTIKTPVSSRTGAVINAL